MSKAKLCALQHHSPDGMPRAMLHPSEQEMRPGMPWRGYTGKDEVRRMKDEAGSTTNARSRT
jgi:hypothetical protein